MEKVKRWRMSSSLLPWSRNGRVLSMGRNETKKRKLSRKRLRASCWVRLIAVNNAGKLHSMVPDVGGIEREPARESVLNTQRPIFYVRGAEIALHGKGIAGSRVATLNQASDAGRINCCGLISPCDARRGGCFQVEGDTGGENVSGASTASGGRTGGVKNGGARRNGPHTESDGILSVLLRHEGAHGEKTINKAASSADDGGTLAGHVPGHPEARGEVSMVRFVDRTDILPDLFKAAARRGCIRAYGRIPIPEQSAGLCRNTLELVAQSKV